MKEFSIAASDGLELSTALFEHDDPKALIQIIHGAKEHKERYYDFIEFLNSNGFAVIISDLRGHGHSVNEEYFLGHMDGIMNIVEDQMLATKYIKELYPEKKLYMFGHSLGSLIARLYLQKHDDEIEKLVMTGTVLPVPIAGLGEKIGDISMKKSGRNAPHGPACLIANFEEDRWVCANPETMRKYRQDRLILDCKYTAAAVNTIMEADEKLADFISYELKNPELKILSATGEKDICTGGAVGLRASFKILNKIGYKRIFSIVYPGMKHEVINEADNARVYKDILNFYES